MEPSSVVDDAEFWLPPEFLTDEDFLVEKENKVGVIHGSGFGSNSCFGSTVKPKSHEDDFLAGLTRQMVLSTLEDDISSGFCGNHAFTTSNDDKSCGATHSPQSTLCGTEKGCGCRNQRSNQNCQSRVSSQTTWDLYCAAAEEVTRMNITNEPYDFNNGRGILDVPRKQSFSASKNPNNGVTGYFNQQPLLQYQKLQAIQFQQLKQQQLLKHHRQMMQQRRGTSVNTNKNGGPVSLLSSSTWSNQFPRIDNSNMRAVFLGDNSKKRSSTGTGVFLPRRIDHNSPVTTQTREKHNISTVLVPARVAQVLQQGAGSVPWSVKAEQAVNEPRLPSDWTY